MIDALEGNEIIVVDNGSEDGSVAFLGERFPQVRVLALPQNLGFGGGSNAGFRAAKNDIVVLLNSDMRVERDFLTPLLAGFEDERTFAVSCQIFFSDPAKLREETGLTEGWWEQGALRVRHRAEPEIRELFPCFYGGGGSCAFDRRKFLELGGFDELLRPFYLEDTDLGYLAWKARLESAVPARQHGVSRTSRDYREALQRRLHPGHPQKEFPAVHLEKYSRLAAFDRALLVHVGQRDAELVVWRFTGAGQFRGHRSGGFAASAGDGFPVAGATSGCD